MPTQSHPFISTHSTPVNTFRGSGSQSPVNVASCGRQSSRHSRLASRHASSLSYALSQSSPTQLHPPSHAHVLPRKNTPKAAVQGPSPATRCGSHPGGKPPLPPVGDVPPVGGAPPVGELPPLGAPPVEAPEAPPVGRPPAGEPPCGV